MRKDRKRKNKGDEKKEGSRRKEKSG